MREGISPAEESFVLSSVSSAQLRAGDPRAAATSISRALEIAVDHCGAMPGARDSVPRLTTLQRGRTGLFIWG